MKWYATMKARLFILFATSTSAAFALLLIIGLMHSKEATADGPTYVSGDIDADTTWSASQSPYLVTDTVTLSTFYTLTIEPGVEVRFAPSTSLTIRGTLIAEGTPSNNIVFTSNTVFTKGSWIGLKIVNNIGNTRGGSASVKFANIFYAQTGLSVECCLGRVNISDSVFSTNVFALGGYSDWVMQVENCTFENNSFAVEGGG